MALPVLIAPSSNSNPSGFAMPSSPPAGFIRVNEDHFLTPVAAGSFPANGGYSTRFAIAGDGDTPSGSGGIGRYSWSAVSVHDSVLDVWLHAENNPLGVLKAYCAQIYPKLPGYGAGVNENHYTYFRTEMAIKFPLARGYKAAPLLWPQSNNWPTDGENDHPECSFISTAHFNAFNHWGASSPGSADSYIGALFDEQWHTFAREWVPGAIRHYMDGVLVHTFTTHIPTTPMRWVWQFEPNLTAEGIPWDSAVEGHILIDWATLDVAV